MAPPDDRSPRSVLVDAGEPFEGPVDDLAAEEAGPASAAGEGSAPEGPPEAGARRAVRVRARGVEAGAADIRRPADGSSADGSSADGSSADDESRGDDRPRVDDGSPGRGGPAPSAVHPRVWQRRVAVLRDQGRRRLRWVVAAVALLLAVCLGVVLLHTPLAAVSQTTVVGAVHTAVAAVVDAAGLAGDPPLIDVNPAAAAARVEALPWVARAVVVRHWPDAVTVTVSERVPLGSIARPGGNVALVDASGRVLAWQPGPSPGLALAVPVPPGPPGTDLAAADRPALVVGAALPGALLGRVQSLSLGPGGTVVLSLSGRLTVDLGTDAQLGAKLASLSAVLGEARPYGPAVIDLTIPDQPTVGPAPPTASGSPGR